MLSTVLSTGLFNMGARLSAGLAAGGGGGATASPVSRPFGGGGGGGGGPPALEQHRVSNALFPKLWNECVTSSMETAAQMQMQMQVQAAVAAGAQKKALVFHVSRRS